MGLSSSKTKTSSSSTPLDQYAPYINQALSSSQQVFNDNQPNLQKLGAQASDVYSGLRGSTAAAQTIASGNGPNASTYTSLTNAGATDPAIDKLNAVGDAGVNPLSSSYYNDVLGGKYLDAGNPYLNNIIQSSDDAVSKAVKQRFSAAGQGTGMSTPYVDLLSKNLANNENSLRYTDYDNQLNRMTAVGGQSDAGYNADQSRKLAAAQSLGSQYTNDNNTELSAANANTQSILSALGLTGSLSAGELQALAGSASLPFAGVSSYADLINALTAKYGNQTGTTTSSQGLGSVLGGIAGAGLAGWASGGFKGV